MVIPSIEINLHQQPDANKATRLAIDQNATRFPADLGQTTRLTQRLMQLAVESEGNMVVALLRALDYYEARPK